jgi:Thioredoxin
MSTSGNSRRDRAAAANSAAMSSERRREQLIRIIGAVVVVLVVVGIVVVAVVVKKGGSSSDAAGATPSASANPSAPLPTGVLPAGDTYAFGVPYGTGTSSVPTLEIWEDFQCPSCDAVEKANGTGITSLAESGKVRLIWRPTTFLDTNLKNDSSERATAAWGCAIDAGKAKEYHSTVFANQPKEGVGYTDANLLQFAQDSGITGAALDTFKKCYSDRTYLSWAANSAQVFYDSNIPGTPLAKLNGTEVAAKDLVDQAALTKLVSDATAAMAGGSGSPAASSSASPSGS